MTFYFIFLNNLEDKISNNIHRGTKRPDSSIYMLLLRYFLIYTINNIKIHKTCFNCTYFLNQTYLMSYLYVLLNISMLMMNFGSQNENEKENTCSLLHKTFAGKNLPKITINVTFFFVCFLVENTEFLRNALKPKHIVKAFNNSKSWLLLPGLCRFNFQLILPLSCSRLSVPRATFHGRLSPRLQKRIHQRDGGVTGVQAEGSRPCGEVSYSCTSVAGPLSYMGEPEEGTATEGDRPG